MSVEFDTSELRSLAATFGDAGSVVAREVQGIIQRGALHIKKDMQREASSSRSFRGVPASISYDVNRSSDGVEAEVGPEIGRAQGSLAFIAYNGTSTMGPVFPDPAGALAREAVKTMEWLGKAAEAAL